MGVQKVRYIQKKSAFLEATAISICFPSFE
jgi:hypothetical protein